MEGLNLPEARILVTLSSSQHILVIEDSILYQQQHTIGMEDSTLLAATYTRHGLVSFGSISIHTLGVSWFVC
ncbi:hypothetical protein BDB00DRAFT_800697, partial [Zychaea mexicana]|uniref:uncharacterized protein n=1 Tax=Zychaea mexicana TaxID=64656 RepID=UPI0022FEF084